jgi:hypothetical protein
MAADDIRASHDTGKSAWIHDLERAVRREQPLGWSTWMAPIYESQCLTAEGLRVAEWAVGVLQGFLGHDFLQRVVDARAEHELLSPSLTTSLWPIFDGRRVYVDLFRLAAQLSLPGGRSKRLQATMANNFHPTAWTHALIQLEVANLALRDGWVSMFETNVGGKKRDVRLVKDTETPLLEILSIGMANLEWEATQFFDAFLMQKLAIEMRHGVHVYGYLGHAAPEDITTQWLQEIDAAAGATARDGLDRWVPGGKEGNVRVTTAELGQGETLLEAASVTTDTWERLEARIKRKGDQTADAGRVWIRLDDHAGMWFFTPLARMSLAERLAVLAPKLREALQPYPHVAGIILSPGRMWAESTMQDETCELPGFEGVVALRRLLPVARVRDTVIVARSGAPDGGWRAFMDWYAQEPTWLDWALQRLGKPPLDALVHEPLSTTEQH